MSKLLAKYVQVKCNEKLLAGLTDCTLNCTLQVLTSQTKSDATPIDTPSYVAWEISVSGVLGREEEGKADAADLKSAIVAGTTVPVEYIIGTLATFKGDALVSSIDIDMPDNADITYSATLRGVSELKEPEEEDPEVEPTNVEEE